MNKDDVIRMAKEAGASFETADSMFSFAYRIRDYLLSTEIHSCHANCQRFACVQTRKAVEAEREACAKVCEDGIVFRGDTTRADYTVVSGLRFAAAIRARKEKQ